jgi:hypothetical protein
MTLQEFITNRDSLRAYQDWLVHPMTQQILEFAQDRIHQIMAAQSPPVEGVEALQRAAVLFSVTFGRQELLEFIQGIDKLAMAPEQSEMPEPDYGAGEILMQDFQKYINKE